MIRFKTPPILVLDNDEEIELPKTFRSIRDIVPFIVKSIYVRLTEGGCSISRAMMDTARQCEYESDSTIRKALRHTASTQLPS
jgi:hypothetical protein